MIRITGFTHLATGTLAGIVLYRNGIDVSIVATTVVGSLFPDIDHPKSKLGRRMPIISHIMYLFGHRGITHSLLFVILLSAVGYFVWTPFFGLAIGSLVHIVGDMLTPSGVPLFWPFGRHHSIFGFQTGGVFDRLLGFAALIGVILVIVRWGA